MEVFRQVKKANLITQMPQIYNTMKDEIDTNLTFEQIASLAFFALDLDPDTELARYALKGEYMEAYNATYYVLDHNTTVNIIKQIFGVDITNSIDWTYSIKYVKNDVARTDLTESIVKLGDYLNQRRATLSDDLINQTESLLTQAQDLLDSTEGSTEESVTDDLTDMTALLESMYTALQSYVPPTPTPAPTVAPTLTPTPTPTPDPEAAS